MIQFIFQMDWLNHHLVIIQIFFLVSILVWMDRFSVLFSGFLQILQKSWVIG